MIAQTSGRVVESVVVAIGIDGSLSSKSISGSQVRVESHPDSTD